MRGILRSVAGLGVGLMVGATALGAEGAAGPAGDTAAPAWRAKVQVFAAEHFHNPAWGYSHSVRDYSLATTLAAEDHMTVDDDVLFAAAFLHDMAAFPPWAKPDKDHADEAAVDVVPVLQEAGFPMQKLAAVQGAIRTHMYDREPRGPEALYLHDADALDWLGAIGIARVIALVDPNGGKPTGPEVIPMLDGNLAKVPSRVLSKAGQARVAAREATLRSFLLELRAQSDDLRAL
jgi:hypothetical protein